MSGDGFDQFPKNPEKRQYQRLDAELPVELEVNGTKLSANTENISCGGMYLPEIANDLKEDMDVVAFVNLPDSVKPVRLTATIKRLEINQANHAVGVGLEFNGLYDDNRLEIDRYIKWKLLN